MDRINRIKRKTDMLLPEHISHEGTKAENAKIPNQISHNKAHRAHKKIETLRLKMPCVK